MKCTIDYALGFAIKVAFCEHRSRTINEADDAIMLTAATPTIFIRQSLCIY